MKTKLFLQLSTLFFLVTMKASAQVDSVAKPLPAKKMASGKHQMNLIKTNLVAISAKNYSLQYERILSRKFSVALQYRMMPESTVPFQKYFLKMTEDNTDPDMVAFFQDMRIKGTAITPEARFYTGKKGYGRGFYLAPFYRYASFDCTDVDIFYADENGNKSNILISGKLTSSTGGLLLGTQYFLGKHIIMDVWAVGLHYGTANGNFTSGSVKELTAAEQDDVREQLDGLPIPLARKTINVNSGSASLKLDGPWGGLRFGISLGARF